MDKAEIMARRDDWNEGISVYMRQKTSGAGLCAAQPLQIKEVASGYQIEPFMRLHIQEAQQLMDELWQCGLRPTEGTGSAGSLKATEKHLEDMRLIAMKKIGIRI
jgi:hypothetical protein